MNEIDRYYRGSCCKLCSEYNLLHISLSNLIAKKKSSVIYMRDNEEYNGKRVMH